ncbi:MAG: radical SAM protein [Deltaproteobacteria bacterium]|nr:radical SAM protein [Deltaproteobacteria bacterium]
MRRAIPVYPFHPSPRRATGVVRQSADDDGFYLSLALGLVAEAARTSDPGRRRYDFEHPVLFSEDDLLGAVRRDGPGVVLFSSYIWNVDANLAASQAVKALDPRCVTIHGGPSTPKHAPITAAFLREQPHVDVTLRGEGELAVGELLGRLADAFDGSAAERARALSGVPGLTFLDASGAVVRNDDRPRIDDLGAVTSPYLSGYFDRVLGAREKRGRPTQLVMATLETNRGCPYNCTFCDWGSLTLQKIRTFPIERVRAELEWIGRHQIHAIFLGDANFGILARDVEVAGVIAETRRRLGYPREVVANYTKNGSKLLAEAFELWNAAGVAFEPTISIQTTDTATLRVVRRSNIKPEKYEELSDVYRAMGLPSRVHLMMGLPGQTVAAWKNDLQFVFARQEAAQIFPTRMLPNSPMAEPSYVAENRIRVDDTSTIVETATFTEAEWREMGRLASAFLIHHNWGVLRYVLMHLQWAHGLRAVDVIHDHTEAVWADPSAFPEASALLRPLFEVWPPELCGSTVATFGRFHERGWAPLFDELATFVERRYGVARDSAFDLVLRVQEAVMPRSGAPASRTLDLEHDFVAYVRSGCRAMLAGEAPQARLESFPRGSLPVRDEQGRNGVFEPDRLRNVTGGDPQWELASPLTERAR